MHWVGVPARVRENTLLGNGTSTTVKFVFAIMELILMIGIFPKKLLIYLARIKFRQES